MPTFVDKRHKLLKVHNWFISDHHERTGQATDATVSEPPLKDRAVTVSVRAEQLGLGPQSGRQHVLS